MVVDSEMIKQLAADVEEKREMFETASGNRTALGFPLEKELQDIVDSCIIAKNKLFVARSTGEI